MAQKKNEVLIVWWQDFPSIEGTANKECSVSLLEYLAYCKPFDYYSYL